MTIETIQQSTQVSDIGLVTFSDIVHDNDNNVYVREFKAFGPQTDGVRPLIFTLKLVAETSEALQITAPIQTF